MTTSSILVQDSTLYLAIEDPELMEALVDATSFKPEGIEYRQRDNRRDKRTKLVSGQKAPVGLLDRICRTMTLHGVQPQISYSQTERAAKPQVPMRLVGVTPRDYQDEAQLAALLNDRGIFRMPTGSGKTLVSLMIVAAKGHHAVIIVPTIDLLHQTRDYFIKHLHRDGLAQWAQTHSLDNLQWKIGQLGDGVVDPQPVTIATARTMAKVLDVAYQTYVYAEYDDADDTQVDRRALKGWVESLGTVIVDEAHQLGATVLYQTMTKIPALYKYGMSASPWRDDNADLMIEAATGPPIYYIPAERLVKEGHLMAPRFVIIDTSKWWNSAAWGSVCKRCGRQRLHWAKACECGCTQFQSQFTEAYREEIVRNEVRNARIATIVRDLDRPSLTLVKQVAHGRDLAERIPGAVFLSGKDRGTIRADVFEGMRQGKIQNIVTTQIGDMGLDIPQLSALILAGGGKSSTRHLQRIGRVVRPSQGKQQPVVIDLDDSHIHAWFSNHIKARRKIELAEWQNTGAEWVQQ